MKRVKEIVHAKKVYQAGYTGKNIRIAVLDTGIAKHPDLTHRDIYFLDMVNQKHSMYDDNGHGTHVAGILCGDGRMNRNRISGMAPDADLVVIKVLDKNGNGETDDVLRALEWVIHNYRIYNIRLLNFSVGFLPGADMEEQRKILDAVEELWDLGVMVVSAAGNNGPSGNSITVPGISRKILTVGASDDLTADTITAPRGYSGKGPTGCCIVKPEVLAPGTRIISCDNKSNGYSIKSGTSMSAPVVCGALALGMEKNPYFYPEDWKLKLYDSVWSRGTDIHQKSWGILHVDNLLQMN